MEQLLHHFENNNIDFFKNDLQKLKCQNLEYSLIKNSSIIEHICLRSNLGDENYVAVWIQID